MTVVPIVLGPLGIVLKVLGKKPEEWEIRRRIESIPTTANRPEYSQECWRLEGTCCHSASSERPPTKAGMKNS